MKHLYLTSSVVAGAIMTGIILQIFVAKDFPSVWGTYLTGVGTLALAFVAVITADRAIAEFRQRTAAETRQANVEKARWLSELFDQFYVKDTFKLVRRKIDFDQVEDLRDLITKNNAPANVFSQADQEQFDRYTDFFNFFELIAYLEHLKQLTQADIESMFEYYMQRLIRIDSSQEIRNYLKKAGFGNLTSLLSSYSGRVGFTQQ
jgi:hypothetical protein